MALPSTGTPISGTSPTGSSIICEDIDECEVTVHGPIDCDINADCVNTRGSYKCQCKTGYQANSYDGTEGSGPRLESRTSDLFGYPCNYRKVGKTESKGLFAMT